MSNNLLQQCITDLIGCRYLLTNLLPENFLSFRNQDILYNLIAQQMNSGIYAEVQGEIECEFSCVWNDSKELQEEMKTANKEEVQQAQKCQGLFQKEKDRALTLLNTFVTQYLQKRIKSKHLRLLKSQKGHDQSTLPLREYLHMSSSYTTEEVLSQQLVNILEKLKFHGVQPLTSNPEAQEVFYITLNYFYLYLTLLEYGIKLYQEYPGVVRFPDMMPIVDPTIIKENACFDDIINFKRNMCFKINCILPSWIWKSTGEMEQAKYLCYTKLKGYNVAFTNNNKKKTNQVDIMLSRGSDV